MSRPLEFSGAPAEDIDIGSVELSILWEEGIVWDKTPKIEKM